MTFSSLRHRGFVIPAAIFLLVVLSALGAFMVTVSVTQHTNAALDVQGSRAYQAARAGIEWELWTVLDPENRNFGKGNGLTVLTCPGTETAATYTCQLPCNPPTTNVLPALSGTLAGFTVSVKCESTDYPENGVLKRIYTITSTASAGGAANSIDFVERRVVATVSTCRQVLNGAPC